MRGILADINVEGIMVHLARIWLSATWREIWFGLGISIESFESLGLRPDSPDAVIWRTCQEQALILITANRNADGPDSLEMVIRGENQPESLPVVTLADAGRVLRERAYAERTAERILDYLMRIDEVRGVGRLYVP
jgi:hypothetical protein